MVYHDYSKFHDPQSRVIKPGRGHIPSIVEMLKHLLKNYTGPIFTKVGLFLSKSHVNIDVNYVAC